MAEGKPIALMVGLVLLLILAAFVLVQFGVLDDFLQNNSNTVTIDSKADMHQLILYDSTIAYVCDNKAGGFYPAPSFHPIFALDSELMWESFANFKEHQDEGHWSFSDLKDALPASKSLECFGSSRSLPTPDNLQSNTGGKKWINDQEGKFSRIGFSIDEDITIGKQGGCFGFQGGRYGGDVFSDTAFVFSDKNSPNRFLFKSSVGKQLKNCRQFGEDSAFDTNWMEDSLLEGRPIPNVFSTVTVISSDGESLESAPKGEVEGGLQPSERFEGSDLAEGVLGAFNSITFPKLDPPVKRYQFKLCEGTTGYIQTNTGGKDAVKGTSGNLNNPEYSAENPPGFSDKEKTGNAKTENKVHPFIVITNNGC